MDSSPSKGSSGNSISVVPPGGAASLKDGSGWLKDPSTSLLGIGLLSWKELLEVLLLKLPLTTGH